VSNKENLDVFKSIVHPLLEFNFFNLQVQQANHAQFNS